MELSFLSWREVDFAGVVPSPQGQESGRPIAQRPSAWFFGLASHLANSVILVFLWAAAIEPNLSWPRWLEGAAFGIVLSLMLAGALVAPMAGLGLMGRKTGGAAYALTNMLIHVLWGALVGFIYVP